MSLKAPMSFKILWPKSCTNIWSRQWVQQACLPIFIIKYWHTPIRQPPDIAPPSLSAHAVLWKGIPYFTAFHRLLRYSATNCGVQTVEVYQDLSLWFLSIYIWTTSVCVLSFLVRGSILTQWGRGHLNCLNARSRGLNNLNQLLYCVSLNIFNKFANYFCELKVSGNTHQRP